MPGEAGWGAEQQGGKGPNHADDVVLEEDIWYERGQSGMLRGVSGSGRAAGGGPVTAEEGGDDLGAGMAAWASDELGQLE